MIYLRELLIFLTHIIKYFRLPSVTFHQKIMKLHINYFYLNDYTLNVQTVLTDSEITIY